MILILKAKMCWIKLKITLILTLILMFQLHIISDQIIKALHNIFLIFYEIIRNVKVTCNNKI